MLTSHRIRSPAIRSPLFLGFTLVCMVLLASCANPGPPRPPSLHLPQMANRVQAERLGDAVILSWEMAAKTTEDDTLRGPVTAAVCREIAGAPGKPACSTVRRVPSTVGINRLEMPLETPLLTAAPVLLTYRLELLNRAGRSAGISAPVFAASGPAPAPTGPLQVTSRQEGALLTWKPVTGTDTMQIERLTIGKGRAPAGQPAAVLPFKSKDDSGRILLHAGGVPGAADPGGMIDRSVRGPQSDAISYLYMAQRLRTIQFAGHTLELAGLPSPAASFTYRDEFPPAAPTGLVTIPASMPPAVDLSWEANAEPDLIGYNVYRRTGEGAFTQLNAQPLPVTAYRDLQVHANTAYGYRVTAVRQHGLESAPGAVVTETVPP